MLAKRIIPCLDVKDGVVVKGVKFRGHEVVGDIVPLARRYAQEGADELVFYDITASSAGRTVDRTWVTRVAQAIDIPFCVAGGIRSVEDAAGLLAAGADKISVNSPALADPALITRLAERFGVQCVVVGIDSWKDPSTGIYWVNQFTGDEKRTRITGRRTLDWVKEVQERGAGEIVLNMMKTACAGVTTSNNSKPCGPFVGFPWSRAAARVKCGISLRRFETPAWTALLRRRYFINKSSTFRNLRTGWTTTARR